MQTENASEEAKIPQTDYVAAALPDLPASARIPDGATLYTGEDDGRCRIIRADGSRCRGTRALSLGGLCGGHAGTGIATNPGGFSKQGHETKKRRAQARAVLGISARRASQPLQAARIAAQIRAQDFAEAVVNAPLDDPELGSIARQTAAIRALELLYPQATASLSIDLPTEAEDVPAMGWADMQALASRLLDPGSQE